MKHVSIILFLVVYFILGIESVSQIGNIIPELLYFELWFLFCCFITSFVFIAGFFFKHVWLENKDTFENIL